MILRIIILVFALLAFGCSGPPDPAGVAITNVTVIDAVNGVRDNQTVIFAGDEIVSVTPVGDAPDAAESVDGTGKFLIPGLWDMHVHLTYDDAFTDIMPGLFLDYGVTSVRDTGGLMHKLLPVVEEMRKPGAVSPRVFFSGPLLDGEYVVYDGVAQEEVGIQNATVEMAEANIPALKEQGVDFIKIYEMVSDEVFDAMVRLAGEHDLPIAAHVPLSLTASIAGPRVGSMEHLRNVEMDCAADAAGLQETRLTLLKNAEGADGSTLRFSLHELQRLPAIASEDMSRCDRVIASLTSTIQVPTARLNALDVLVPLDRPDWDDAIAHLPDSVPEAWRDVPYWIAKDPEERDRRYAEWSLAMIGRMNAAGVPIGAGTDTPIGAAIPGYSLHNELDMLVRAGLTPLEALRAATVTPAEFFSLEDQMGTIDVGKRADLVLLDADPMLDIHNTRTVNTVVSRGLIVRSPEDPSTTQ